jgi:hypothetical protein
LGTVVVRILCSAALLPFPYNILFRSDSGLGEELDRMKTEVRQKLLAAEMEVLVLKSQLELLEHQGRKMFRRELSSIETTERLEFQSEVEGIPESSDLSDLLNGVPSDWSLSPLLDSDNRTLLPGRQSF